MAHAKRADILIGADGVKSAIRAQIFGASPASYTGDAAWRLIVPAARLPANLVGQVMSVWMGPGQHVVCYYLRGGSLFNFVGLVETDEVSEESWPAKHPWKSLEGRFRQLARRHSNGHRQMRSRLLLSLEINGSTAITL